MVIGIIGESCTGKSTLADRLGPALRAEVYAGKDYIRLAKSEDAARRLFREKLESAVTGENIIYVISENEHLDLLPDKAFRVLVTADLALIKERFAQRTRGHLPPPVAAMLEKKHGCFDDVAHHIHVVSGRADPDDVCADIQKMLERA